MLSGGGAKTATTASSLSSPSAKIFFKRLLIEDLSTQTARPSRFSRLENIDDGLRERLGRAGLIAADKNVSSGELIELYMEAESSLLKTGDARR